MRGKIIVIDGLDGSGKSTQASRVFNALKKETDKLRLISYPDYEDPSSTLVRMYLNGEFSEHPDSVNAYAASSFYAVDRYAGYMRHWKTDYENGALILATRYVSSNAIHQTAKLPFEEWEGFLNWLTDYEYNKLAIPRPDKIIFLDMPREVADRLLGSRYHGDEAKRDIHEKDREYLMRCQKTAAYAAKKEGWTVVSCAENGKPFSEEAITQKILNAIHEEE